MSISIKVLSFLSLAFVSAVTFAVPTLQLGIGGGEYDLLSETIVTSDHSFTLHAYGHATGSSMTSTFGVSLKGGDYQVTSPYGPCKNQSVTYQN